MSQLTELTNKLREIFQINRADLDFGIYRILNSRAKQIEHYLQERLPEKVRNSFSESGKHLIDSRLKELETVKQGLIAAGVNPESAPKVKELQAEIAQLRQGSINNENAIYNHLLTFFSRYYEEGDFISQRRYRGNTYAIPYNGEEVLLHWANKDQYYTKSSEDFSNYRFTLEDGRCVFFRLITADTAKDNRKDGKRIFALAQERAIERENADGGYDTEQITAVKESHDGQTLEICFEYTEAKHFSESRQSDNKASSRKPQQAANTAAVETLKAAIGSHWQAVWAACPTEKQADRTLLEKHLAEYTQKNTADYFIHKDLGGFLRRELDFYIKNEVMRLDDIQHAESFTRIERNLLLIQTLRGIAHDIIGFLAQLENFQKKLWLKKKFVVESSYLITLNHIPDCLLGDTLTNPRQFEAWNNLFDFKELPPPPPAWC